MKSKSGNVKKLILAMAVLVLIGSTIFYFVNLQAMVSSHLEEYLVFPMFLSVAGIVLLAISKITRREAWEGNCILAGVALLTLAAVCMICSSRINCCSGG